MTATRTVWERETLRWTPGIATFVAQGTRAERLKVMGEYDDHPTDIPGTRKMLIINLEMVRAKRLEVCPAAPDGVCAFGGRVPPHGHVKHEYHATPDFPFLSQGTLWDAIIFDESHNLLASTANVQSKRITQGRFGAVQIRKRLRPTGIAIALSGTPFRSKVEKGWGTLNWLRPDVFKSYWQWAGTFFGVEEGSYGKVVGGGEKVLEPRDPEAWDRMLRPYYLKRTKADAAPDLPPISFAGTPVDADDPNSPCYVQIEMDPAQLKAYHQMESLAEANLVSGKITATGVLAEITRLRQFATATHDIGLGRQHLVPTLPSNKIDWLIDFMQEREGTGQKVVVASSFSSMVELAAKTIRRELNMEVMTLTGETSDRDRSNLVARFQDPHDTCQVVCLNRDAGGESITLDLADEMVTLDMPWISDRDEQLYARIHRVSRIHKVTIYRLMSIDTIDQQIANLNDEQRAVVLKSSPRKLSEIMDLKKK
jgi:SNF2 family DNA or RNA helicase